MALVLSGEKDEMTRRKIAPSHFVLQHPMKMVNTLHWELNENDHFDNLLLKYVSNCRFNSSLLGSRTKVSSVAHLSSVTTSERKKVDY